jgi:hypothetical protein
MPAASVRAVSVSLAVGAAIVAGACGKMGAPLPPLRPLPAAVTDLAAHRVENRIELTFTVPAANADTTTPAAIERVEVWALTSAPGTPAPTALQIVADPKNVKDRIPVNAEPPDAKAGSEPAAAAQAAADKRPRPGDRVSLVETIDPAALGGAEAWHFIAVGVSSVRGRYGPLSPVVSVPVSALPDPPSALTMTNDETTLTLKWQGAESQRYRVYAVDTPNDPSTAKLLTPAPIAAAEFSAPVAFGRPLCFTVRAVLVNGGASTDSAPAPVSCFTPKDTYPPPRPEGLQALQDGTAVSVTLIWTAVTANDLAGYMVYRGENTAENLRSLTREAIQTTTFKDSTVQQGVTYVYAVVALDTAGNPSERSQPQSVTVR